MNDDMREAARAMVEEPILPGMGLGPTQMAGAIAQAEGHLSAGRSEEAMRDYGLLVLGDPAEMTYQKGLARAALANGTYEVALQSASSIILHQPRQPDGFFLSAMACMGLGETDCASEDFADALRLAEAAGNSGIAAQARRGLDVLQAGAGG